MRNNVLLSGILPLLLIRGVVAQTPETAPAQPTGNGIFLAVGYGGLRMTSRDGKTWENITEWGKDGGDDENLLFSAVIVGGKAFVVGGGAQTGHVMVTSDGKTWREAYRTTTRVIPILYGKGIFLAGRADQLILSRDGEKWEDAFKTGLEGSVHFRRGAFGNGVFVFAGDVDSPPDGKRTDFRFTTSDGKTITALQTGMSPTRSIAFGAGRFVLIGKDGFRQTSTDGKTWVRSDQPGEDFQWICRAGDEFLLGGKDLWSSKDGVTWMKRAGLPAYPACLAFGNGTYIGSSWKGNAFWATEPLKWTQAKWGETNAIESVAFGVLKGE